MADELGGNNAVQEVPASPAMTAIPDKADAEARLSAELNRLKNPTAAQDAGVQDKATPSEAKAPAENKDEVPQQFRTKDGELDATKVEQSKQHLDKLVQDKRAALEAYKAQQRELAKINQELSGVKSAAEAPGAPAPVPSAVPERFSPEFKQAFRARLESDPEGALADFAAAIVRAEISADRQERREEKVVTRIQELANDGNDWLLTKDGVDRVNGLFSEHPEILQGKDPYGLAVKILGGASNGMASGQAQPGPKTPILSGGGAVPPIPNPNAGSGLQALESTGQELLRNYNDPAKAAALKAQADKQMQEVLARYRR